ncbi:hypothetical protein PVAP13_3KG059800 [Panicum virgatum]|uniref:Uncharacterized protein n=1 Tax=Panicum virgatum TaxID=38727 RepID=A0A8T0UFH4_PANVG|nr:hypothetical protein PVAP13_3KG059800 [Panicum virgatum]
MIVVPVDGGGGEEATELDQGYGAMSSELELCVARIRALRAELELERRMRRKAEALSEALAAELAGERRQGEAVEAGAVRGEAERALAVAEEERRMRCVVELWREERVQMKLADAMAAMEERLREIDDAVAELRATAAASDNHKSSCCGSSGSPNGKASPTSQQSPSHSQHGQESPSQSQHSQVHRRKAAANGENPHIRRGIKGFVEFPKAVRMRPREDRADLVPNLECQRAAAAGLAAVVGMWAPAAGLGGRADDANRLMA